MAYAALMHITKRGYPPHLAPPPNTAATLHRFFFLNATLLRIRKGHITRNISRISVQESGQILSANVTWFLAPEGFHIFRICVLRVAWGMSAEMAHVTLAAKRRDLTLAPVLICTGINSFSRILARNGEQEKQTLPDSQTCVVCPWLYLKMYPTHPLWSLNWTQKQGNDSPRAPTLPRATWLYLMVKTILLLQLERRSAVWRSLEFLNAVHPAGCGKALSFAMATGIGFTEGIAQHLERCFRIRFGAFWRLQFSADFWFHAADPAQSKPQSSSNSVVIWTRKHGLGFGVTSNFQQLSDLRAVATACSFTRWQGCERNFSWMSWSRHGHVMSRHFCYGIKQPVKALRLSRNITEGSEGS